ncbi:MAG TPA: M48 family metalloprotease, partial [Candidatus Limnocylindria bacterium]|nr:M48 family metalloprotease [Candidatus Limnocylindria bacterium]
MRPSRFAAAFTAAALLAAPCRVVASNAERELGRRFMLEARSQLPLEDDPAPNELLRTLGTQLVEKLGPQEFDYHFYVIEHPTLNAFAVPGGYIFFFSGLIGRVNSDDELAGVLGHEIAHISAHHMARQQTAGQLWTAAALLGMLASLVNPVLGAGALAAAQTAQLKYSRDYEQEADYLGLGLVGRAGYDPHALASFFQELLTEQRLNPAGVPAYMLSHPVTQERVAKAESIISAQRLVTPPGRPMRSLALQEAQAVVRAQNGPKEEVLAEYRRAAEAKPTDPIARFLLGRAYQVVGQTDAARKELEESRRLGGAELREQRALGAVYLAANRPEDAKKAFDAYLARYPRDAWSHLMLGRAQSAAGDEAAAMQEFRRAISLDPEFGPAHRELGIALGRQGKEGEGFYHLAIAAREHGDLQQAFGFFQRAAAALPKGDARQPEIEAALEELKPLVRDPRALPGDPP